jgi:hypothetical protein
MNPAEFDECIRRLNDCEGPGAACNKNDASDAEAICEAMSRLHMRLVNMKTVRLWSGVWDGLLLLDQCVKVLDQEIEVIAANDSVVSSLLRTVHLRSSSKANMTAPKGIMNSQIFIPMPDVPSRALAHGL